MNNLFALLRIKQWTKNFICFAGILFSGYITNLEFWQLTTKVFFCFALVSSSVYIFNDIIDMDSDAVHPKKKNRPIASGQISIEFGLIIGFILLISGLFGAIFFSFKTFIILLLYLMNNFFYSIYLKTIPIADVFSISFGFILRLLAGIYIIGELPTAWILLCTMFMTLFLGFSKRWAELNSINNLSKNNFMQRKVLKEYSSSFLKSLINDSSLGALLSYSLFTVASNKSPNLILTVPIVYYAIAYYRKLLFEKKHGEEPDLILLNDKFLILIIAFWLICYLALEKINHKIIL
ncbi:decaprenyl-phosphate phosphoribosyltransferase [Candidatus Marinimicrobia bacterium]|nr:decaprenyl-phosphate phosphoribosyltransferase [Candidatus Neomarinimicrobiota bacterium]